MSLTGSQLQAVAYRDGNLQLIACAGSGKTEVVAQHIAGLLTPVATGGAGLLPRNIVAFTFTEKAAVLTAAQGNVVALSVQCSRAVVDVHLGWSKTVGHQER